MAEYDLTCSGRHCTKCGQFKPLDSFSKAKKGFLGRNARCRACVAEYQRKNKDRINALSLARYHRLQVPIRQAKALANRNNKEAVTKICTSCKQVKCKSEFGPMGKSLDGLRPYCRPCKALESRAYRARNPDSSAKSSSDWVKRNQEKVAARRRRFQSKHSYKVMHAISSRIYLMLKGSKSIRTEILVGYTAPELVSHLERQFLPGMSWNNYGKWHVDHIRPLKSFQEINEESIRQAWGLANLRPLWAKDNMKKSVKQTHLI